MTIYLDVFGAIVKHMIGNNNNSALVIGIEDAYHEEIV